MSGDSAGRSEPGIPSARTLRGSENVTPSGGEGGSRGACGEMETGVRSGGWTPMRDSGSVTIRGVDPGQERTTHSAASPGGHEPATWRQHREEEEEERERSKARGKNHRSHQIAPMTPMIL
ncbi:hypothetical protein [Paramuribaculum intestinale]|uniref:hypothetical protein n=2 Tax=Paramuribaculum intestinale TaxID=2094151 RepID=UPI0025B706E4|nr:hypothetical protein [Paramuribaculum intestinale]